MTKVKKHSLPYFDMQFFTSTISIMMVLLLLGTILFFVFTANALSVFVRENIHISLILSDDMNQTELKRLQSQLNLAPYVKNSTYISKEDAVKEYMESMNIEDPRAFLGNNPLKASFEILLNSEYANSDSIAVIRKQLMENKKVLKFEFQESLIDTVNENISKISLFLLIIAALLTIISFALINNTIRLAVYSKRFLIHTMKLVGASWRFIRRPFLRKNIAIGFTAGLLANIILIGCIYSLLQYEPQLTRIITFEVLFIVCGAVWLFGIFITWICARISINKYLKMKASSLYYI